MSEVTESALARGMAASMARATAAEAREAKLLAALEQIADKVFIHSSDYARDVYIIARAASHEDKEPRA